MNMPAKNAAPVKPWSLPKPPSRPLWRPALVQAFVKLDPRQLQRSPVMLVVELTAILTTVLCFVPRHHRGSPLLWWQIAVAGIHQGRHFFAEALAEGRGRARADSLRLAAKA